jgi:PAS domain S-box-containing protein
MADALRRFRPPLPAIALTAVAALVLVDTFAHGVSDNGQLELSLVTLAMVGVTALMLARSHACTDLETRRLRGELERRDAVVDGAGEAIIVIDDQATIVTFNRAAERMFGYAAVEMIGTSLERLMTDGARQAHAAYLERNGVTAMVEAARLRSIHKGVRKRGEVFPFELSMTEWLDGDRRMFTGVLRDVTRDERAAEALRESHARFAGLYEHTPEPLFVFALTGDGSFALESMNGAAEAFTRLSRFAMAGRTPESLVAPEDARALRRALLHSLAAPGSLAAEVTVRLHGVAGAARLTISPMRDAKGEIRRVLARASRAAAKPAASGAARPLAG